MTRGICGELIMPKIRRRNLPPALYVHLLDRVQQRSISGQHLRLMVRRMDTQPEVPNGKWFKRFPGLIVCGEGELIKTFMVTGQLPEGTELEWPFRKTAATRQVLG